MSKANGSDVPHVQRNLLVSDYCEIVRLRKLGNLYRIATVIDHRDIAD